MSTLVIGECCDGFTLELLDAKRNPVVEHHYINQEDFFNELVDFMTRAAPYLGIKIETIEEY